MNNETYAYNRQMFLSILNELDIKGKYSGKWFVWRAGSPCDIIGVVLDRLGYKPENNHNSYLHDPRRDTIFGCPMPGLYFEIDRKGSTNKTIRAFVTDIFNRNKLETTEENNVS